MLKKHHAERKGKGVGIILVSAFAGGHHLVNLEGFIVANA